MAAKDKADKEAKAAEKAAQKAAAKEAKEAAKANAKSKSKKKAAPPSEYNFFLLHGEKILIVVAIGIFGALVAMGSGLEKFTLTPEQINQSSSSADKTIKDSTTTAIEFDESVKVFPYDSYAELIKSSIKVNSYETPNRWEQSLFPDKVKRPDVVPLPLENLRAVACVGAIMYNELTATTNKAGSSNNGGGGAGGMMGGGMGGGMAGGGMGGGMGGVGGGELKGRKWITLTGSLPIRKQQAAYNELFSNAQYLDDVRDQPRYLFYELQRAEVGPSGSVEDESAWKKIDVIRAIKKENQQWSGIGYDQVGDNYLAPVVSNFPPMAMSCPPMANKPFGEEVANLPNIPLNSTEQIKVQDSEIKEWSKLQEDMNKFEESDLLDRDPFADSGMMGGAGGGMGVGGGVGGGMGSNSNDNSNSWLVNQNAIQESMIRVEQSVSVDYYLFRYFDFDVEEGPTYVYRVKLLLANPNYGVQESFVEDPATVEKRIIESEFSKSSNPVALGAVARVYAENVEAPAKPGAEPVITLSSVYFDEEDASESVSAGLRMRRGQMANFFGQSHNPVDVPGSNSMMDMSDTGKKGKGKAKAKSVNHISNQCVVDALGGERITGVELRSPGKIMMLEPNGLLKVQEVKEDARELKRYDNSGMAGGLGAGGAGMMM